MAETVTNVEKYKTIKNITLESNREGFKSVTFQLPSYGIQLTISQSPTYNCQIMSFGYIYYIAQLSNSKEVLKEILQLCIQLGIIKNMIMVDVRSDYVQKTKDLFEPYLKNNPYTDQKITLETPYKSTTGTNMTLLLLNIDWSKVEKD